MIRRSLGVALWALCACSPRHTASSDLTADPWIDLTLAVLSLREKVGQMIMPWIGGEYLSTDSPEFDRLTSWVQHDAIGGVVVSIGLPHSYAAKLNALQRRARVPLLVASDMESGPGQRLSGIWALPYLLHQGGGTEFPPAMALGATGSDSLARAVGGVIAREARAVGVHVTFGPVLDVNSNPANPIINTRSYGEDPELVARLATAYVSGARDGGLMTTAKHFPGHGDTETDSHLDLPSIRGDRARLDSIELAPYRRVLRSGIDGVMSAHIAVVGIEGSDAPPATLSRRFMTGVLRDELAFRGLVYTDAMDMGAIVKRYGTDEPVVRAVEAGADIVLMPVNVPAAITAIVSAVQQGRVAERRIDESVRRILAAKQRAGLTRSRLVNVNAVDSVVGRRAHTQLAARVAERSITLARDSRNLVPLTGTARRVLFITYAAAADLVAGRTFAGALERTGRRIDTVRVDNRTAGAELAALGARVDSADVVIAATFVSPTEGTGSITTQRTFADFVQRLAVARKPVIVVSFGSPYVLGAFPAVTSFLLAWGGTDVSQRAAAHALLGDAPITGKLPVSLPPYHSRGEGLTRQSIPR